LCVFINYTIKYNIIPKIKIPHPGSASGFKQPDFKNKNVDLINKNIVYLENVNNHPDSLEN